MRSLVGFGLAVLCVLALALAACGGGSTTQKIVCPGQPDGICPEAIDGPDVPAEGVIGPEGTTTTKTLEFKDPTDDLGQATAGKKSYNATVYYNEKKSLSVLYKNGGNPVSGAAIDYIVKPEGTDLGQLSAGMAYTGDDGIGAVDVQAADKEGDFTVSACVNGEADVPCLTFKIHVTCKGCGDDPLTVGFDDYKGAYPMIDLAQVLIFKQGADGKPKCADLKLGALPPATIASKDQGLDSNFVFKALPGLDKDGTQTYSIVGMAREGDTGPVQAWACDDTQGVVKYKEKKYVLLTWKDVAPRLAGSYEITSTFDLSSGLPPDIRNVVDTITGFFLSPTGEVMKLFCAASGSSGSLADFCGYLFQDKANPDPTKLTTTGQVVFDIIDGVLLALMDKYCPFEDKSLCSKVFWTAKDVSSSIEKFQIIATFTFATEPDDSGAVKDVKEVWHSVRLRWTLGMDCPPDDDACGWKKFSFSAIPAIAESVAGKSDVTLANGRISIAEHKITMKYGALVNFALEKWLLPSLFGDGSDTLPAVDSYEALVGSLLAGKACLTDMSCCETFAEEVTNTPGTGVTKTLVKSACDALIQYGGKYLRDKLNALDATPDNFTLATEEPCRIEDKNKDMKFDAIGSKIEPCKWDSTLRVGSFDYKPVGTFYGTAQ
ncbi:MAG: hypothetical protein FJ087_16105 [Deltaproteobacteria bacterium]|nr:hypothetical protein [Deltaproteobacteria bacterium]